MSDKSLSIPAQLRAIAAALPEGARVGIQVPCALNERREFVPLPPETSEVTIFMNGRWSSFYVKDGEWEAGAVGDEIVAYVKEQGRTE